MKIGIPKTMVLTILIFLVGIPLCLAYEPHKQNTELQFSFTSNNATSCNVTTANTPNGVILINQESTKSGQTFNNTIGGGNFSSLGNYCFVIECSDGVQTEGGSLCREITPSGQGGNANIIFFIFIILMIYGITFTGFFGKNIPITILGGMAMLFLGVYLVSQGVIIFRDNITIYFSYLTIGLGVITSFWALLEQFEVI